MEGVFYLAEKLSEVYEMYDYTILRTGRGRGAVLLDTEQGLLQLRQVNAGENRLRTEYQLKEALAELGFANVDRLVENREGNLVSYDRYGNGYVLRSFFRGREMNITDTNEIIRGVKNLARFHQAGRQAWRDTDTDVQIRERSDAKRRNREMKRVHNFIAKKSPKKEFEEMYMKAFSYFYYQGLACENKKEQISPLHLGYCHGSYNHHSLLLVDGDRGQEIATVNFDKFYVGNQLRDLYHFLRKTVEKNGYSYSILESILSTYGELCPLSMEDIDYIYCLYCYPEKFYKLSNQYMNGAKNWISPKSVEKLNQIVEDEPKKQELLEQFKENKGKYLSAD